MIDLVFCLALALVVWRLCSFLVGEYGPFHVFSKIRHLVGVRYDEYSRSVTTNPIAEIFTCVKCMSVWLSWLVVGVGYYTPDPLQYVSRVLIVSAMCIMINRWISGTS